MTLVVIAAVIAVALAIIKPGQGTTPTGGRSPSTLNHDAGHRAAQSRGSASRRPPAAARIVGVASIVYAFRDPTRTVSLPTGQIVPRTVKTLVVYPRLVAAASGSRGRRRFPLIVFGHGFAVSPRPYHLLLTRWARAGYVVAAPIFPLENVDAPGGPDERDLVNEPADIRLVIDGMLHLPAGARLAGLVDPRRIAVAGQSDGGDAALGAAYDPPVRDDRISAAIILSGAEDPFAAAFAMPAHGPPLLAIQGTADTVNPPPDTYQFFDAAAPPKYLLRLIGAGHQPPYTVPGAALSQVERMTLAFLADYLKGKRRDLTTLVSRASAGPGTQLTADR